MARLNKIENLHEKSDHAFDIYKNLGYNYNSQMLSKVISPELFGNPLNDTPLRQIEKLMQELVNQVERIKFEEAWSKKLRASFLFVKFADYETKFLKKILKYGRFVPYQIKYPYLL